jgi:hypothetical protein
MHEKADILIGHVFKDVAQEYVWQVHTLLSKNFSVWLVIPHAGLRDLFVLEWNHFMHAEPNLQLQNDSNGLKNKDNTLCIVSAEHTNPVGWVEISLQRYTVVHFQYFSVEMLIEQILETYDLSVFKNQLTNNIYQMLSLLEGMVWEEFIDFIIRIAMALQHKEDEEYVLQMVYTTYETFLETKTGSIYMDTKPEKILPPLIFNWLHNKAKTELPLEYLQQWILQYLVVEKKWSMRKCSLWLNISRSTCYTYLRKFSQNIV